MPSRYAFKNLIVAVRGQTPALERVANRKIARAPDPRDADALALELRDLAEIGPRDDLERESVERRGEADEVGAGHVRVDVGDAAAREKVDLARERRLDGARADRDVEHVEVEPLSFPQVELFHEIER